MQAFQPPGSVRFRDIQLQSTNYDCDNILVSRSGSETVQVASRVVV
jgi:hypothetical protein